MCEDNKALPVHLEEAAEADKLCWHFKVGRSRFYNAMKCIMFSKPVPAKKIMKGIRAELYAHWKLLKLSMFTSSSDSNLQKIGTK